MTEVTIEPLGGQLSQATHSLDLRRAARLETACPWVGWPWLAIGGYGSTSTSQSKRLKTPSQANPRIFCQLCGLPRLRRLEGNERNSQRGKFSQSGVFMRFSLQEVTSIKSQASSTSPSHHLNLLVFPHCSPQIHVHAPTLAIHKRRRPGCAAARLLFRFLSLFAGQLHQLLSLL